MFRRFLYSGCLFVIAVSGFAFGVDDGTVVRGVKRADGLFGIEVALDDNVKLQSPVEGLWSVGLGWEGQWPARWVHGGARTIEKNDEWVILNGEIVIGGGKMVLRDAYRRKGEAIECVRRFEWKGKETLKQCTLSGRWQIKGTEPEIFLPGILYYGNPSGAKSGRVAVYNGKAGEQAIFEEHRYTMPFASVEFKHDGRYFGGAMHTIPSKAAFGNIGDQWWSLGAVGMEGGTELVAFSGPVAANGKRGVVKALQRGFMDYEDVYINIAPGGIVEKHFFLEVYPVAQKGSGFYEPMETSLEIFEPYSSYGMPSFEEIIRTKCRFAISRWYEDSGYAGFGMYPRSIAKPKLVMGWCGQAAACGYALQLLGERAGVEDTRNMVQKSLDHLSGSPFNENGFMLIYDAATNKWGGQDPVSQGQGMDNFANAIRVGRKSKKYDTSKWETFLKKACDVHAGRILKAGWKPRNTAEGFFISPLCKGYELFGKKEYRLAAIKAADHYGARHVSMDEPYWGGTLDASCEDKEGAWSALQGFLAAYEMTGDKKYLAWAEHACGVAVSYVVVWDMDLPAGRLADHGFDSRGWTMVSAQNQHLDVFGVLFAPSVYRMGQLLDRDEWKKLGIVMYRNCGQLMDPFGSQGEQIQQTNFAQHGDMSNVYKLRGGYSEGWTVFWITAHFLNAAAQFEELGVEVLD